MIVRGDLKPGLAAAQAVHAAFKFAVEHPDLVGPWMADSQYLVVLQVPEEVDIWELQADAGSRGAKWSTWQEPDMDNEATAIVLEPGDIARRVCARLPLFGKELVASG